MNRDDVLRMAREAGFEVSVTYVGDAPVDATIRLRGDEYMSKAILEHSVSTRYPEVLERFAAMVAAAEREACAVVAESVFRYGHDGYHISAAIRARGDK